ncbi:hypothetical protein FVEG_05192 [Fusarium verticillioides 7600]|uniref:Uncharacterized protein n=1 Tax=Gibberella moniliformis (strain M3125 / FGSC 7600) TaxID=334819 RepID=W7LXF7_GIBM7|nr:hypothetical protein FVEG_05192 [Fusarium verticillioides 7600]EWG43943.1 hypothetical protein FVEG_05192 [Fusarium verticillioides 7600]
MSEHVIDELPIRRFLWLIHSSFTSDELLVTHRPLWKSKTYPGTKSHRGLRSKE